ncbi:DUF4315 family protein [Butyrivibrio sp. INlla14]|uniref:DUF4315 family protein n=1 Tax=Butyrivibrio sp. INlla14 TaxID=1520808 RepID=UPI000876CB96|nr:DUF4315 family protein [Butyrivibrio sp. INlla14]SCY11028.1 protein of unknown function [Butyrivibrio sp. INlla14]
MYERLDRLREEVSRLEKRRDDVEERLKAAKQKLKEAEASQILSEVGALKLTPEQVSQFLQMAASGQLPTMVQNPGMGTSAIASDDVPNYSRSLDEDEEDKEDYLDEDE